MKTNYSTQIMIGTMTIVSQAHQKTLIDIILFLGLLTMFIIISTINVINEQ